MIAYISGFLDAEQLRSLRDFMQRAQFVDGRATNPESTIKQNEQVKGGSSEYTNAAAMVAKCVSENPQVQINVFPKRIIQPTFSRYTAGMAYGAHVDRAMMGKYPDSIRSDASITVFLSDKSEYEGGELELWLGSERHRVKLDAGDAVVYPTGAIHQVRRVTRGTRLAAVSWMQSYYRDSNARILMSQYCELMNRIRPGADETTKLLMNTIKANLDRIWMEI